MKTWMSSSVKVMKDDSVFNTLRAHLRAFRQHRPQQQKADLMNDRKTSKIEPA